jgi:hypothetical protein
MPDWTVELENGDAQIWEPGSASFRLLENSWRNWEPLIRKASRKRGIPASWILAFINAETGFKSADPMVQASCGPWSVQCRNTCCAGLMQVMVTPYKIYEQAGYRDPKDMMDPLKAIDAGAYILARLARTSGAELPAMASSYNQGSPRSGSVHCPGGQAHTCSPSAWGMCSDPGYIQRVVTGNNTAVRFFKANDATSSMWLYLAAGAAAAALALAFMRR